MYNLPNFLLHLIQETHDYLYDIRKDHIDFKFWFDDSEGVYKARFTFGRVGEGSPIECVCAAIANAITAVEQDLLKHI